MPGDTVTVTGTLNAFRTKATLLTDLGQARIVPSLVRTILSGMRTAGTIRRIAGFGRDAAQGSGNRTLI